MRNDKYRHPFAHSANKINHMPYLLRGYEPIVKRETLWQRIKKGFGYELHCNTDAGGY